MGNVATQATKMVIEGHLLDTNGLKPKEKMLGKIK
jgi:hypothetical protein